jgi:hypothetical protein
MVALVDTHFQSRQQHSGSLGRSPSNSRGIGAAIGTAPLPLSMRRRATKAEVVDAFLANLRARGGIDVDAPGFAESVKHHFETLPTRCVPRSSHGHCPQMPRNHFVNLVFVVFRLLLPCRRYALDVNIDSLDVLNHKRLLDSARTDPTAVSFQVRPVDVTTTAAAVVDMSRRPSFGSSLDTSGMSHSLHNFMVRCIGGSFFQGKSAAKNSTARVSLATDSTLPSLQETEPHIRLTKLNHPLKPFLNVLQAQRAGLSPHRAGARQLPRPAFGSSPNLQALVLEAEERLDAAAGSAASTFYEVTIASADQPKLLSRLSESLGDVGLNIAEAHAFNSKDRFALDVFVVNGWTGGNTDDLEEVLSQRLQELPPPSSSQHGRGGSPAAAATTVGDPEQRIPSEELERMQRAAASGTGAADDWELDPNDIVFHDKIASGAFGDLFRGSYCGQDVAIKILRGVQDDTAQFSEFLQEVAIMRKVRHKNVVQFIGACTKKPNLCIVFEFMPGGSVYDYVRKHGCLRVGAVLKVAVEVCRGMDYLHKRNIVHRDLKAANLLLDDTGVVKIADFGVARVMDGPGVMTAETGTYRWMAPEVIEHAPYSEKADVFSFGIVLWELLTGRVPYSDMTPLQAAVAVVQKGLRPPLPSTCPPPLADVMRLCWQRDPVVRPSFEHLKMKLEELYEVYRSQDVAPAGRRPAQVAVGTAAAGGGGLLSRLRAAGGGGAAAGKK